MRVRTHILGVRTVPAESENSRVLILYNLGTPSTSEKSSRWTLKHSRLLYIHISQNRYDVEIYRDIFERTFMVDN